MLLPPPAMPGTAWRRPSATRTGQLEGTGNAQGPLRAGAVDGDRPLARVGWAFSALASASTVSLKRCGVLGPPAWRGVRGCGVLVLWVGGAVGCRSDG